MHASRQGRAWRWAGYVAALALALAAIFTLAFILVEAEHRGPVFGTVLACAGLLVLIPLVPPAQAALLGRGRDLPYWRLYLDTLYFMVLMILGMGLFLPFMFLEMAFIVGGGAVLFGPVALVLYLLQAAGVDAGQELSWGETLLFLGLSVIATTLEVVYWRWLRKPARGLWERLMDMLVAMIQTVRS